MERRGTESSTYRNDFLALDQPILNPGGFDRCLVAWGVHPLDKVALNVATVRILGGMAGQRSLTIDGLTTYLPAAAFEHFFLETPPQPSVPIPHSKQERSARVFWEEPSVTSLRDGLMDSDYIACPSCETYGDLISHMYPGPEIWCQGLDRDPADSQFVVPLWLPHYDATLGTRDHVILIEMVCQPPEGEAQHSSSAFVMRE
jgi:hypothetical protein